MGNFMFSFSRLPGREIIGTYYFLSFQLEFPFLINVYQYKALWRTVESRPLRKGCIIVVKNNNEIGIGGLE